MDVKDYFSGVINTDEKSLKHEAQFTVVPVYIVTEASQLPADFLDPSPERKLVIGFDCEGVDLCRNGTLCIMQVKVIMPKFFVLF